MVTSPASAGVSPASSREALTAGEVFPGRGHIHRAVVIALQIVLGAGFQGHLDEPASSPTPGAKADLARLRLNR